MAGKTAFLFMFIILMGCSVTVEEGHIAEERKAIEAEVEKLHAQFNQSAFDEIIENAHPAFFANQKRQDLVRAMADTRKQYGSFESVTDKKINIVVRSPVEGRAAYNSKYERSDTTETFIFMKEGAEFKLVQYNIFPGTIRLSHERN
jgi:hypothetical protein